MRLTSPLRTDDIGLYHLRRGRRGLVILDENIHVDIWDRVLCEGVPISLRELVSLTASQLGLANNLSNLHKLLQCSWSLGWHVTAKTSCGVTSHYWGGGVTTKTTSNYLRGDWIEIAGTELCRGVQTSRLARVICGVKIRNIKKIFGEPAIDNDVWENQACKAGDYVVYLIVRYASAHPDTGRRRGPKFRPLCPGELKNTHCLWKWHERPVNFRRGCWRQRPWERHQHLFGDSPEQQELRKKQEARAWYDVIQSSNILAHANVQCDWDRPEAFLQSVMWC